MAKKVIAVNIDKAVIEKVKEQAKQNDCSVSAWFELAAVEYLNKPNLNEFSKA